MNTANTTNESWFDAVRDYAHNAPLIAAGLFVALLAVAVLIISGIIDGLQHQNTTILRWGFTAGLAGFAATAIGALPAVMINRLSSRSEDSLLGFRPLIYAAAEQQ